MASGRIELDKVYYVNCMEEKQDQGERSRGTLQGYHQQGRELLIGEGSKARLGISSAVKYHMGD